MNTYSKYNCFKRNVRGRGRWTKKIGPQSGNKNIILSTNRSMGCFVFCFQPVCSLRSNLNGSRMGTDCSHPHLLRTICTIAKLQPVARAHISYLKDRYHQFDFSIDPQCLSVGQLVSRLVCQSTPLCKNFVKLLVWFRGLQLNYFKDNCFFFF